MAEEKITVYEPNERHKIGFFRIWFIMIRNIIISRDLIYQLFKRDFISVYKKSFLGISWVFISPVFGILSWVFMNAAGVLKPGDVGIPYPAYVLISTNIWGLFIGFYKTGAETLKAGQGFILQVNYPHEALLVKQLANYLANYILSFVLVVGLLIAFGVMPDWKIVFFPVILLPLFFLGGGLGLIISVTTAITDEANKIMDILLGLMLFITPVIYSPKIDSELVQSIINYNPLTYLVGGIRDLILFGYIKDPTEFTIYTAASLVFFMFSWRLFFISENKVIERMI